jgi:hypothetical protein
LAVLSEENHDNLSALKEVPIYSYLKKVIIGNSLRKITPISRAQKRMCALSFEEYYTVIFQEKNYENLRALHGFCVQWHLKKIPTVNSFWDIVRISAVEGVRIHCQVHIGNSSRRKSRESQEPRRGLCLP